MKGQLRHGHMSIVLQDTCTYTSLWAACVNLLDSQNLSAQNSSS